MLVIVPGFIPLNEAVLNKEFEDIPTVEMVPSKYLTCIVAPEISE
jgi:hypothetical protein